MNATRLMQFREQVRHMSSEEMRAIAAMILCKREELGEELRVVSEELAATREKRAETRPDYWSSLHG
jgi:hypothetical protein